MIALDTNTALRSFRDSEYDLEELAKGLAFLAGTVPAIYEFKYADGKVQPMASAALIRMLASSFSRLIVGNAVGIGLKEGGVVIGCATEQCRQLAFLAQQVLPSVSPELAAAAQGALQQLDAMTGLQARIDAITLEQVDGDPMPVEGSRITKLTVEGPVSVKDASAAFEGRVLNGLDVQRLNATRCEAVTVNVGSSSSLDGVVDRLTASAMYCSSDRRPCLNEVAGRYGGTAESPLWYGIEEHQPDIAEAVELRNGSVSVVFDALPPYQQGQAQFTYSVPYYNGDSIEYLPVDSIAVMLSSEKYKSSGPNGMRDLLVWPAWTVYTEDSSSSYHTYWQARTLIGLTSFPVVLVYNMADVAIEGVANAWQFTKFLPVVQGGSTLYQYSDSIYAQPKVGAARGVVSVLNRITIPPRSSVEFLFSYDEQTNTAIMSPTRDLI